MVSEEEIDRLRKEARTIFAHLDKIDRVLEKAQHREGKHWDDGELTKRFRSPSGEVIEVNLDFGKSASENAQIRYNKAKELEEELEKKKKVQGPLASAPDKPLTYLILNHLEKVEGDYPKSISYNLNAELKEIRDLCKELVDRGLLKRLPSGMLKRKKVKLKKSKETHQHHTYYKLSKKGDHLLRYLGEKEGKKSFLLKQKICRKIAKRLSNNGADYPRKTADDFGYNYREMKRYYRALLVVGLVKKYDGQIIKGKERKLSPKDEPHKKHTYYVINQVTDQLLRKLE